MAKEKKRLSNDELAGRLLVLEALTVAALGAAMRFGRVVLPPEHSVKILDGVKNAVRSRIASPDEPISASGELEAYRYLSNLLSEIAETVIPKPRDSKPPTDTDKA